MMISTQMKLKQRENGLSPPYDSRQIIALTFFIIQPFLYFFLNHQVLASKPNQIKAYSNALALAYTVFYLVQWWYHIRLTLSNAAFVYAEDQVPSEKFLRCALCSIEVNDNTKHCRKCNKCIHAFDHHCKWVNNCVGSKNYRVFAGFITAVFVSHSIKLLSEILCFYNILYGSTPKTGQAGNVSQSDIFLAISMIVEGILDIIVIVGVAELGVFHFWLAYKRISTYEWILTQREKKLPKEPLQSPNSTHGNMYGGSNPDFPEFSGTVNNTNVSMESPEVYGKGDKGKIDKGKIDKGKIGIIMSKDQNLVLDKEKAFLKGTDLGSTTTLTNLRRSMFGTTTSGPVDK